MIDFAGPWEVFQDAQGDAPGQEFRLFTVGTSRDPIRTSGGMSVVPDYTFADAPAAKVVVIGAQRGAPELNDWLRRVRRDADVVMSVCTGAFHLGAAGLLDGKPATTHHDFYDRFASRFPAVRLERGQRVVQSDGVVYTAGGLSSGIDLALHIVERYYGASGRRADRGLHGVPGHGMEEVVSGFSRTPGASRWKRSARICTLR